MNPLQWLLFFGFTITVMASGYCPYCGQERATGWQYCATCGKSLPANRHSPQSRSIPTHSRSAQPPRPKSESLFSGGSLFSSPSSKKSSKAFASQLQGLLGSGAAKKLMGLKGQNVSPSQLQELNQNPQVQRLMQQFKNRGFQGNLMQGLQSAPAAKDNAQYQQQMQQIQGLFKLLNMQQGTQGGAMDTEALKGLFTP